MKLMNHGAMFPLLLRALLWLQLVLASEEVLGRQEANGTVPSAASLAGCKSSCGDLTIIYPFGIGPHCSRGSDFALTCNESAQPPILLLRDGITQAYLALHPQPQATNQMKHLTQLGSTAQCLLHDRMRDLVFIKFNSKLRQKKDNKDRDPLEKPVSDALEDEDNEWITGVEPTEIDSEQEGEIGATSQGVAAAQAPQGQEKRKGGNQTRKRKRLIPIDDDELSASSSDGENDSAMPSDSLSDSEAE